MERHDHYDSKGNYTGRSYVKDCNSSYSGSVSSRPKDGPMTRLGVRLFLLPFLLTWPYYYHMVNEPQNLIYSIIIITVSFVACETMFVALFFPACAWLTHLLQKISQL